MTSFSYVLSGIWSKKGGVPFALTRYQVEELGEKTTSIATLTNATDAGVVVAHNVYSLSLVIRILQIIGEAANTTTTCENDYA